MANITKVYLLNVPLENDYRHTIYFASKADQTSYFSSKVLSKHKYTDFSYQRKEGYIRIPAQFDDVIGCNYVMYQNTAYSDKWFYAFITDIKYINDERTDVYIETDVMQTWLFDYSVKESFVEREHVSDDTIGIHTIPEQLETGDYIINDRIKYGKLGYSRYIVGATVNLFDSAFPNLEAGLYNGVSTGFRYYFFNDTATLGGVLADLADAGKSDAISCIFMAPREFLPLEGEDYTAQRVMESVGVQSYNWSSSTYAGVAQGKITKPASINGYVPKNNKLFTYPYCYLNMSNNAGNSAIYKYEYFYNGSICDFKINFALTPGCSIRLIPLYYNNLSENNDEGLNAGKYPICGWNTDVYTNWLTQNSVNIATSYASSAISIGASLASIIGGAVASATGAGAAVGVPAIIGGVTGIATGVTGVASTMGEVYQHSLQPPQSQGNVNAGDVMCAQGDLTFTAYRMSIKAEYAKIIDQYFTMFGYKVNTVKVPNKNHRARFWYTKTLDVNIDGAIPQDDLQKIKNCYNTGITFWKNGTTINDYSTANGIS